MNIPNCEEFVKIESENEGSNIKKATRRLC